MAIIEEIGSKIASAGQKTKKAITDFSQGSKIKDAINEERKKTSQLYFAIGQSYYEQYGIEVKDEPYASYCAQIREIQVKIAYLEDELTKLQNMKNCPNCGTTSGYDSLFCPKCGSPFPRQETGGEDVVRFCFNCGGTLIEGSDFCTACGQRITLVSVGTDFSNSESEAEAGDEAAEAEEAILICEQCGAELLEGAVFCVGCGFKRQGLMSL